MDLIEHLNRFAIKNFIPYEEAIALKELGYNEMGLYVYNNKNKLVQKSPTISILHCVNIDGGHGAQCVAPMYQQAFAWFREEHNLSTVIKNHRISRPIRKAFTVTIYKDDNFGSVYVTGTQHGTFIDTYEEAELDCIRRMIDTIKNK